MIKILNPHSHHAHSTTVKTAEIMSKYRPIAPKPETSVNDDDPSSPMSQKISQSPYLRSLWPQLQARPTRTRKRGRGGVASPPLGLKRSRTTATSATAAQHVLGFSATAPVKTMPFQAFPAIVPSLARVGCALENVGSSGLVTLPLLQCSPPPPPSSSVPAATTGPEIECMEPKREGNGVIDLNVSAEALEERDFLQQLQGPITTATTTTTSTVIVPQPIRPVGSSISVACINPDTNSSLPTNQIPKKPEEVEEEVESEDLPAVISDSNNRVRLVNSAYREMVGQPECSWLGSMVNGRTGSQRICGEVVLRSCESRVPVSANGFSCWVRIEWGRDDKKFIHAFCDVIRLACRSKDYLFTWRFHTNSREASQSSCNA